MRGMPARRKIVTAALLALVALSGATGCSDDKDKPAAKSGGDLPAADGLLRESATAMQAVETVKFTIEITGKPGGVPLRKVDGQLAKAGNAKGKVQLDQAGTLSELEYVVVGTTAYIKGPTGGWQSVPLSVASTVYDPSAILDPQRGISKLLETASGGHTEAREEAGGVDAYRVAASLARRWWARSCPASARARPGRCGSARRTSCRCGSSCRCRPPRAARRRRCS